MAGHDTFTDLARYYDRIMAHVDYERWYLVTLAVSQLAPRPCLHLDAACGTGTLVKKLRRIGWNSVGLDISLPMIRNGKKCSTGLPGGVADLRRLPLHESVDYLTCLFDSVNFLLKEEDIRAAFREVAGALRPSGVFYFDFVTERMVLDHFAGQKWTEENGGFHTTWDSRYDHRTRIADTRVQVGSGPGSVIRERIYEPNEIASALDAAGLRLLGMYDAESWRSVGKKTIRVWTSSPSKAKPAPSRRPSAPS